MSNQYHAVTFPSVFYAVRAEKLVKGKDIECQMVQVLRSITSDCTMGMRIASCNTDTVESLLNDNGIDCKLVPWPE